MDITLKSGEVSAKIVSKGAELNLSQSASVS